LNEPPRSPVGSPLDGHIRCSSGECTVKLGDHAQGGSGMAPSAIRFDDGAAYEQLMGVWSRNAGRDFLEFLSPPADVRWLDVGCGNGAFTDLVARGHAPRALVGIDPSEGQLTYARTRLEGTGAVFRRGDAMALPYDDGVFDIAVMALVIHFVTDPARAVAEMARVVRPGGTVAAYVWDYGLGLSPLDPLEAVLVTIGIASVVPPSIGVTSEAALRLLWAQAGLVGVETTVITTRRNFAGFDELWDAATGTGRMKGLVSTLEAPVVERIRAGLQARLPADADGRITYSAVANAVRGRVPA
jgi:SAM-dependent methyltransferase